MTVKTGAVYFYTTAVGERGLPMAPDLAAAVTKHGKNLPEIAVNGNTYQVRDLVHVGHVWKGVFALLRDDAPHVVTVHGHEHPLNLDAGDRLLEKCHFLYFTGTDVLVWQYQRGLGGMSTFQQYLSQVLAATVTVPQLMNNAQLEHVMAGQVYELQFTYSRVGHLTAKAPQWNQNAFNMMESVHAAKAKFMLRAPRNGSLAETVKAWIRRLVQDHEFEKVRVKMTDESNPIDLFLAPLKDSIEVEFIGRYPVAARVYEALSEAHDRQRDSLPAALRP